MTNRRRFFGIGAAVLLFAGVFAVAQAKLTQGKEYTLISPPQSTEAGAGKVEVIEFFWYGCPHCFDLEPHLKKWSSKLPGDVAFRQVPAIFRDSWVPGAKAFYALEALGELERLHGKLFDAIHAERRVDPGSEKSITDWVVAQGVDRKRFTDAYNSFTVQSKTGRAQQMTRAYRFGGVPALAVEGKYLTSVGMAGSHEALGGVLDELIALARSEKKK